jgi:hypothetical protein
MLYFHTEFHVLCSIGSLVIVIKQKNENFPLLPHHYFTARKKMPLPKFYILRSYITTQHFLTLL